MRPIGSRGSHTTTPACETNGAWQVRPEAFWDPTTSIPVEQCGVTVESHSQLTRQYPGRSPHTLGLRYCTPRLGLLKQPHLAGRISEIFKPSPEGSDLPNRLNSDKSHCACGHFFGPGVGIALDVGHCARRRSRAGGGSRSPIFGAGRSGVADQAAVVAVGHVSDVIVVLGGELALFCDRGGRVATQVVWPIPVGLTLD
jgi:hypothetical protein